MPFTKDSARDDITRELLLGATPAQLAKKYPVKSVYRIFDELVDTGRISPSGTISVNVDNETLLEPEEQPGNQESGYPFVPAEPAVETQAQPKGRPRTATQIGAEIVSFPGEKSLPADAVSRIRGILGISLRPKVLSCPMPELLYPSMVIAVTELGFQPMRPDDFIDTVLYQWLESCDYVPYAYMKRTELEDYAKKYGLNIEEYAKEHGLMTADEFAEKFGVTLAVEKELEVPSDGDEVIEPAVVELQEEIAEMQEEANEEAKETGDEPHKPTVGDLLARLNINNIRRMEVENDSSECTEPGSPQGDIEPGERDEESQD